MPIVYDFDDAIFLPNVSEANRAISFLKDPGRVATILRRSTQRRGRQRVSRRVCAPAQSGGHRHPDGRGYRPVRAAGGPSHRRRAARPVVGWIGSPTTFPYLEALAGVLREVSATHPFTLKVSGAGRPVQFPGVHVEEVPWSLGDEVSSCSTPATSASIR